MVYSENATRYAPGFTGSEARPSAQSVRTGTGGPGCTPRTGGPPSPAGPSARTSGAGDGGCTARRAPCAARASRHTLDMRLNGFGNETPWLSEHVVLAHRRSVHRADRKLRCRSSHPDLGRCARVVRDHQLHRRLGCAGAPELVLQLLVRLELEGFSVRSRRWAARRGLQVWRPSARTSLHRDQLRGRPHVPARTCGLVLRLQVQVGAIHDSARLAATQQRLVPRRLGRRRRVSRWVARVRRVRQSLLGHSRRGAVACSIHGA